MSVPRSLIAIGIDQDRVSALGASITGKGVEVERWLSSQLPATVNVRDASAVGTWLGAEMERAGLGRGKLAVAVPRFELATAAVYRRWDDLGEPVAPAIDARHLPPSLRRFEDLGNDLLAAARHVRPDLGDWMEDLAERWERPVLLTGSGPACFGFFGDEDEAAAAAAAVGEVRAVWSGSPATVGVVVEG